MSLRRPVTVAGSRKPIPSASISTNNRRSKSALAKTAAPTDEPQQDEPMVHPMSPREKYRRPISANEDGTNIQVVIRCRRRSDREIQEGSPVVVMTDGPRSQGIVVETGSVTSVLGVVTAAPTRSYPFDRVFGPEADQAMVYNDVVAPILEQVLSGYNCTLFAYGQTGTGKTYTMQGDLVPSHLGNPSVNAGMIPRVLYKLFHYLENNVPDYSVKISFLELYNEELRDLLASDVLPPTGNAQPMSLGAGQQTQGALRIFDDSSKRGVLVQGLEETPVKDVADAIALLTKGSQRRQIAATKFNDHSSRSHSIFSIVVHLKETSSLGDDMLRVGKLNLVDLAGSENIGRSGAENKRAREAGMINQSLLTLGRVINALVDKSSHVPYRESKLTRLLQDSLGGRTKTCIIATVSPAKCNLEETISTLDYALRAKDIRNKPEVNQRLTKNALLKEYINEIERLKTDLVAAREMNGIYFSQESWDQISGENEERRVLYEEAKRQIVIIQSQLSAVREEFEQCMGLLHDREGELQETKSLLEATTNTLRLKREEVALTKRELHDETIVRQAHQKTELVLNNIALELKAALEDSMADVKALFEKIGREDNATAVAKKAVSTNGKILEMELLNMEDHLNEFIKSQATSSEQVHLVIRDFETSQVKSLQEHIAMIQRQLGELADFVEHILSTESISDSALQTLQESVQGAIETMNGTLDTWCTNLAHYCETLCRSVHENGSQNAKAVENAIKSMAELVRTTLRELQGYLKQEHTAWADSHIYAGNTARTELERLRGQNQMLTQLVENERIQAEHAKKDLVEHIAALLSGFIQNRDHRLQDTISEVQQSIAQGEASMDGLLATQDEKWEVGMKRRVDWEVALNEYEKNGHQIQIRGDKALSNVIQTFEQGLTTIQSRLSDSLSQQAKETKKEAGTINSACSKVITEFRHTKRARVEAVRKLQQKQTEDFTSLTQGLSHLSKATEHDMSMVMQETVIMQNLASAYNNTTIEQLSNTKDISRNMVQKGTKKVSPTGTTPTKQERNYPKQWGLTQPRDELLREWIDSMTDKPLNKLDMPVTTPFHSGEPVTMTPQTLYSSDLCIDSNTKEDSQHIPQNSISSNTSSTSGYAQPVYVHRSTGANGFGKVTKIPSISENALKDRLINVVPIKSKGR